MLKYHTVPLTGYESHSHAIQIIEPGPFEGLTYIYLRIGFAGEDKLGQGRILFEYKIIVPPAEPVDSKVLVNELAIILNEILKESTSISEVEQRETEITEELQRIQNLPDEVIVAQTDGTTVELVELLPEDT